MSSGHGAPDSIQRRTSCCSSAESGSPSAGIRLSWSSVTIRLKSSLSSGLPGTMPTDPESPPAIVFSRSSI